MVSRHGPALLRVANQFSLCHDDALDAYQRALEIYLRRLDTVEVATEGAWMRVVVKHEAMAIRRSRAQSVDRDDVDLDANVAFARDVDEEVAGGERVDRSVEALRALKPDEAKALMLKAHGLSYQEIGRRFGWTYTKTNRAITEGRRRFIKEFKGIEEGEACARYEDVLAALADGSATSAQVVSIRPHLRHCTACRAAVREMRLTRRRRIALLLPWAAVISRAELWLQYAGASGGGRLGAAAALVGVCISGTGAVCIVGNGGPDRPPVIAHATPTPAPKHHARTSRKPAATVTPVATFVVARVTSTATPPRTHAAKHSRPIAKKKSAKKDEFGFEASAGSSGSGDTPSITASTASVKPSSGGGGGGGHAAKSSPGEFGFEGG